MVKKCKQCGKPLSDDSNQKLCEYCKMKNTEQRNIIGAAAFGVVLTIGSLAWKGMKSGGKTALKIAQFMKNLKV